MPDSLPASTKFAVLHLWRCYCDGIVSAPVTLPHGLAVHTAPFVSLSDSQTARVGQDHAEHFKEANFILMASATSSTPHTMDQESRDLEGKLYALYHSLFLLGEPKYADAVGMWGGTDATGLVWSPRCWIEPAVYRAPGVVPAPIDSGKITDTIPITDGLLKVFATAGSWDRVRRGFGALRDAWRTPSVYERLHQFVRAIEGGLLALPQGKGASEFAHRLQTIGTGTTFAQTATELYWLRNVDEHLGDWPAGLAHVALADRTKLVALRAFQAELIACAAFRTLFANPALHGHFIDNAAIQAFWAQHTSLWPSQLDLDSASTAFDPELLKE